MYSKTPNIINDYHFQHVGSAHLFFHYQWHALNNSLNKIESNSKIWMKSIQNDIIWKVRIFLFDCIIKLVETMIMFRISRKSQPMHRNRSAYHANNGLIIQTFCISMTSFGYLVFCIAYKMQWKEKTSRWWKCRILKDNKY